MEDDIRWIQRFSNYQKALKKLGEAIKTISKDEVLDELHQEGLIQRFEFTHELSWKVMKDYAEYQGYTGISGSRDAIRKALEMNIIDNPVWMETIGDINLTSHDYDGKKANEISFKIINIYYPMFCNFENKMIELSRI